MKTKILSFLAFALLLSACDGPKITPDQAKELAKEAYIYAFPAVEHNKVIWKFLDNDKLKPNQFFANTELLTPEHTTVVSPNNDTYYTYAVLDIRNEPVVITIPKIEKRYFSFQLCDIFTNCPEYISTLATGEGPGNYLIARSDWNGKTPQGINKVIKIPATMVFTLARTQVFSPTDKEAAIISKSYKAVPLSQFAGTTAPAGEALTWPYKPFDSKAGDVEGFFNMFNTMVQYQILNENDKALMEKYAAIGLGVGKAINKSECKPEIWEAIETGANEAKKEIEAKTSSIGKTVNGWNFSPENAGRWGTDYMTNAAAAWKYIYVNTPQEAIYPTANVDSEGNTLNGANPYTLTFTKEEIPQVRFFWSLTMYNNKGFLVANPLKRYNINSDVNKLTYGKDGSLTLYIQKDNPGKAKESNWLPAPDGQFYMILRMYGPSDDAIQGKTIVPAIVKTK